MFKNNLEWDTLLRDLNVNRESPSQGDIEKLNNWCKKNIKSTFSSGNLNEIKAIVEKYSELKNHPLNKMVDERLKYTVPHETAKLGFDCLLETILSSSKEEQLTAHLNQASANGNTPLHLAASNNEANSIGVLLDYGADREKMNKRNQLPLSLLSPNKVGSEACAKQLLPNNQDKLAVADDIGRPNFFSLVQSLPADEVVRLLDHKPGLTELKDNRRRNVLHVAIENGKVDLVNKLTKFTPLLTGTTDNHSTALHLACQSGEEKLISPLLEAYATQGDGLLNSQDEHRNTALHYLTEKPGCDQLISKFIEKGAKLDVQNAHGKTPLGLKPPAP